MVATPNGAKSKQRLLGVFMCHSSQDKPAVRDLYQRLKKDGFAPWLDDENLIPGQDWQKEIDKAVRGSDVVLVCMSKSSVNKEGYVQKEIRVALDVADEKPEGAIFIIPGRLEEDVDVPLRLRHRQWVNLFQETGYRKLVVALNKRSSDLGIPISPTKRKLQPRRKRKLHVTISNQMLPPGASALTRTVQGRQLKFTNLKKVFYPADGYTKGDIINFYAAVADLLVPHLEGRPLSLKRYPNGIEGAFFFQKAAAASFPDWLHTEEIATGADATTRVVVCDDKVSLLYLANLGCIDQNPWMSRVGSLDEPDFIVIDLDPYHCAFDRIVEAAQLVRRRLDLIGLQAYPKTTGGDGMHVYVPVRAGYTYEQTRNFAQLLSHLVVAERPELFTTPRNVAARQKGKVYFDWMQNAEGKTISAPYVLRAYPGAPVATPLSWDEVQFGLKPAQFHIGNVLRRFERTGDLFAGMLDKRQRIEPAIEKLTEISNWL